jgi:hypothetical protein
MLLGLFLNTHSGSRLVATEDKSVVILDIGHEKIGTLPDAL